MAKLRLGVIGAGSWAVAAHLPNFARYTDLIEFVGVSRLGQEPLQRIQQQYGFQVASEDYREVIRAGADICVVSSPTALHYEHARAALEAGAHVLLEKPVTIDPQQAWDLVSIAQRTNRHIVIVFGWNYKPMVRQAKRLMDTGGGIGTVEQVMIAMSSQTRELLMNTGAYPDADRDTVPEQATWTNPTVSGGGYGQAQLSHALALALWLTGLRGKEAVGFMSAPYHAPVELHDAIALRFDNGAIGTLSGGSAHMGANDNKHQLQVQAIGSEGQFQLDVDREYVWRFRAPGMTERLVLQPGDGAYDSLGPVETIINLALGRPAENCSPIELGARTVEILHAAYRSAQSGRVESI